MKKTFFLVLFLSLPLMISAQNLNGSITSSFYTFERFDSLNTSDTFIRNFEALSLNLNYKKISLRTRMNLETNLGKTLNNDPYVRFYNLYFEARDIFDLFTLKLGRQPLFTPVTGGLFDGVNLKFRYSNVSITGFYGGNVPAYQKLKITDDFKNNYVLGGKFEVNFLDHFNFGLSYMDKNFKPLDITAWRLDGNLNLIQVLIEQKSNQFKFLTAEASYFVDGKVNLNTRYQYDINFKALSKFEVNGRVQATDALGVDVYYNFREPKIRYNSIFSVFDYGNSQEVEGGIDYKFSKDIMIFGKYGNVTYKDENSTRLNIGTTTKYGSLSYRKTFGYAGELDVISIYTAYTFAEGFITPSIGIAFTSYKLSEDSEVNNITTLLGGINLRPWTDFSFDLQGQYFNNIIYKNDFRVLFKVNYWFNTNL